MGEGSTTNYSETIPFPFPTNSPPPKKNVTRFGVSKPQPKTANRCVFPNDILGRG